MSLGDVWHLMCQHLIHVRKNKLPAHIAISDFVLELKVSLYCFSNKKCESLACILTTDIWQSYCTVEVKVPYQFMIVMIRVSYVTYHLLLFNITAN